MEYVKQLIALALILILFPILISPRTLRGTLWFRWHRSRWEGANFLESDYGASYIRGMRFGGITFLGYSLIQVPPLSIPGNYLASGLAGLSAFVFGMYTSERV